MRSNLCRKSSNGTTLIKYFESEIMRYVFQYGDILDIEADVLVCSGNVFLNLSGGVGGAILVRYGNEMQSELHRYLSENDLKSVPSGSVIRTGPCGTPYRFVLHAVAIDAFYDTNPELVESCIRRSFEICAENKIKKVALCALATGYGRFPMKDFVRIVDEVRNTDYPPIREVVICLKNKDDLDF